MRVLIVDDDSVALTLLRSTLVGAGYQVESAGNGRDALEIVRGGSCRLIISDWSMPKMTGIELCRAIRQDPSSSDIYIILLTAHGTLQEKVEGLSAGADDFITKPFEPPELLARIHTGERLLNSALAKRTQLLQAELIERRRVEEALQQSEERYRLTIDTSLDAVITIDVDGVITNWSGRAAEIFGWSREEATGRSLSQTIIPREHREAHTRGLAHFLATGEGPVLNKLIEISAVHRNGREFPVELAITPIRAGGKALFSAFVRDITERKQATEVRERLAAIVDSSPDAIVGMTLDGVITNWNAGADYIFGYTPDEAIGQPLTMLIPPDRREDERKILETLRRGEHVKLYETVRMRKDGRWIHVAISASPIRDPAGRIIGAAKIARDITDRKRAEAEFREGQMRYRFLADAMPQIVWSTGRSGGTDYCNRQWYNYTGLTEEQTRTAGWQQTLHTDDGERARVRWAASLRTGEAFEAECRLKRASDGEYRWHLVRAFPMRDEDGEIVQWVGTSTDIHDQKRAEEALEIHRIEIERANRELSEKNIKLTELYRTAQSFVDDVSHEFRTPLTVIKEFSSIIRDGLAGETNPEQREYLDIIVSRIDDLGTMVDDLLDISKLEAGMLGVCRRPHSIDELLTGVKTTLERKAAAQHVSLEFDIDNDLPLAFCDSEKLGRIIINLTVNAIKFSNEGSRVNLWARRSDDGSNIVIGVTDHGSGIAPENVQAIFERFKQVGSCKQTRVKGFGLGLNIAKELVRMNLGEMHVESQLGRGSTFSFYVPVADPPAIVTKWLKQIERTNARDAQVSILSARVGANVSQATLDDLEQFMQHQVRNCDVMLTCGPNAWIWVVATDREGIAQLNARLKEALSDENRNRPAGTLPTVTFQVKGTWRLRDQERKFLECFEAQMGAQELCKA